MIERLQIGARDLLKRTAIPEEETIPSATMCAQGGREDQLQEKKSSKTEDSEDSETRCKTQILPRQLTVRQKTLHCHAQVREGLLGRRTAPEPYKQTDETHELHNQRRR